MSESHDAIMTRHDDGTVTVEHADPVIWVSPELLAQAEAWALPTGTDQVLQLDTAGEYLYGKTGIAPDDRYLTYERLTDA
jgi:hypothetical protein